MDSRQKQAPYANVSSSLFSISTYSLCFTYPCLQGALGIKVSPAVQTLPAYVSVFYNASVWTGENSGPCTAFGVTADGRIAWLGGHLADAVAARLGPATEHTNLQGAFVMPVRRQCSRRYCQHSTE